MDEKLREQKLTEAGELRKQADAAQAIGASVCNLAPVVAKELEALVSMKVQTMALDKEWEAALAAARNSGTDETKQQLAALGSLLILHSREAGKRIMEHGEQLKHLASSKVGKAEAIAELVSELMPQQEDAQQEGAGEAEP